MFDEIAEKNGDKQWDEWRTRVLDAKDDIATFVGTRLGANGARYVTWHQGSFNLCLQIAFDDAPNAIIRFPGPGHTTFRDEKMEKEVQVINFLHENTTIPIPRLISWGLTEDDNNPMGFGPFMISDFVEGTSLCTVLSDPADIHRPYLNPDIDQKALDTVFEQIADFLLQLHQFNFSSIGSISKTSNSWQVTGRPLTYTMNELATTAFFPVDKFPTGPFHSAREYFDYIVQEQLTHLQTQRNLIFSKDEAKERYTARHLFAQLVDKYCLNDDNGCFKLFCDDLRPQNKLVDPDTLRITAVLDLEFTNALPSQFASEPPWWLLLVGPDMFLYRGHTMDEFFTAYAPRLEQFLGAMQRAEKARDVQGQHHLGEKALSDLMRESWSSKRFWFNYAARKPYDVEVLFRGALDEKTKGCIESLSPEAQAGLDDFIETKMTQLYAYIDDCKVLL